jgi:hypothetical protein
MIGTGGRKWRQSVVPSESTTSSASLAASSAQHRFLDHHGAVTTTTKTKNYQTKFKVPDYTAINSHTSFTINILLLTV